MHYRVTHETRYQYEQPVDHCHNQAYMLPRDTHVQSCIFSSVVVSPDACTAQERIDAFGNRAYDFSILKPHDSLRIVATSEVTIETNPLDILAYEKQSCGQVREQLFYSSSDETISASDFLFASPLIPYVESIAEFARPLFFTQNDFLDAVKQLNQKIYAEFEYDPEFSEISTPLSEVLKHRRGVCQDFTQLAICCLRAMGFPARYVSGYIESANDGTGNELVGAHASHSWFSVYVPNQGWFDFDPTNNQVPAQQHIVTAWGRDYSDVSPLKGTISGGGDSHTLEVDVRVERL